MKSSHSVDVAVIGAGPVGMVLACELIRHGLSVRIVDKAPATKNYSRAPVFWPRAQEALDLMGLHSLWDGHTQPMRRVHVNIYGQPAGTLALDAGVSAHATPMLVGQDVTEQILDAHLKTLGRPVERSTEAIGVVLRDGGVDVTVNHAGVEETFDAAWVIGCEGTHSVVRQAAGIGWEGHPLKGLMVPIADAKTKWPLINAVGHCHVALTDKGYMLTIPLPGGLQRIIVAVPDTTPHGEEPTITLEGMAQVASEGIGGPVELSDSPWVAVVRYGNYLATTYRAGRALLAGDAAHSIAPLSGQGMNTGVQDAFDLAWKLAYVHKGWAPDALLQSYATDRRPLAERLVHATDRFFASILDPSAFQKQLFRAAGPVALRFRKVRDMIAEFYTELDVTYSDSGLSDTQSRRFPRPGEHVFDGELVRWPTLDPIRLYDLLRGLHWTVIAFSGADPAPEPMIDVRQRLETMIGRWGAHRLHGTLLIQAARGPARPDSQAADGSSVSIALDSWGSVHEMYGASDGGLLLVRPDGYVALHRGLSDADFEATQKLLAEVFGQEGETGGRADRWLP